MLYVSDLRLAHVGKMPALQFITSGSCLLQTISAMPAAGYAYAKTISANSKIISAHSKAISDTTIAIFNTTIAISAMSII